MNALRLGGAFLCVSVFSEFFFIVYNRIMTNDWCILLGDRYMYTLKCSGGNWKLSIV